MTGFNPRDPLFIDDPYQSYKALRMTAPVWRSPFGRVFLSRYHDVSTFLRDRRLGTGFSDAEFLINRFGRSAPAEPAVREFSNMLLMMDPPRHTRLRGLFSRAFVARKVEGMRQRIQHIVDDLLNEVTSQGRMDVIREFAFPFTVLVICDLLGVPKQDWPHFVAAAATGSGAVLLDPLLPTRSQLDRCNERTLATGAYFEHLFEARRTAPSDDLLSLLVHAEEADEALNAEELRANVTFLFAAGHETTVNLIGNGVWCLLRDSELSERVRSDHSLVQDLVEETLRYESPVQAIARTAMEPIEFGGEGIERGELVIGLVGAAHRDPEVFRDPDIFDINRERFHPLSFGSGIHFCLGAQLARLEAEIAISTLIRRMPDIRISRHYHPAWRENFTMRGLASLPVEWTSTVQ